MVRDFQQGIEQLTQIVERNRILKLAAPEPIRGRMAFYFVASGYDKEWLFTLSHEALSDLPAMKTYQQAADRFARGLEGRFRNKSANLFLCAAGIPVAIQIEWPQEPFGNRAASYVRVSVSDTRDGRVAHCYVVITHQQSIFDLKEDPFLIQESIVNSIRLYIDADKIKFYPETAHPIELQEVKLAVKASIVTTSDSIDNFIRGKVIWLGFRSGDATSAVWIADPWDAGYLGTSAAELKRAAEVLNARSELQLDPTHEFASIGRELLARVREFERDREREKHGQQYGKDGGQWDVFISHASEDKDSFVRPLAEALTKRGVRVWFDEYSLSLGDSLSRSIDQGLSRCKFGIVVLSPAFFSKEWTQKELGGLLSRESDGQKIIRPIGHNLSARDVRQYSPMLSDRFAVSSAEGLTRVVDKILESLGHQIKDMGAEQ
jgi:hypothetical protein